jgi:hypothetical protein
MGDHCIIRVMHAGLSVHQTLHFATVFGSFWCHLHGEAVRVANGHLVCHQQPFPPSIISYP